MKKSTKYTSLLLVLALCFYLINPVLAAEYSKWFKGAAYSPYLAEVLTSDSSIPSGSDPSWENKGGSTVVLSAHAFYDPAAGWGEERVRVWSREERANIYMDPDGSDTYWTGSSPKTIRAIVGFRAENYESDSLLWILETEPAETNESTSIITEFWYDILGYYLYGFSGTIRAIINGFQASVIKTNVSAQPDNIYFQYTNLNGLGIDLSDNYTYDQADLANDDLQSSTSALYHYDLHHTITNYPVWAYGRVMYQSLYSNPWGSSYQYVYAWSGLASVHHTVNTN